MGMYCVCKPHFCSNFDCKLEAVRLQRNNFYIKERIKRKITNCFELPVRFFLKQEITIAANFQSASAAPDSSSSLILSVITLGRKSEFSRSEWYMAFSETTLAAWLLIAYHCISSRTEDKLFISFSHNDREFVTKKNTKKLLKTLISFRMRESSRPIPKVRSPATLSGLLCSSRPLFDLTQINLSVFLFLPFLVIWSYWFWFALNFWPVWSFGFWFNFHFWPNSSVWF